MKRLFLKCANKWIKIILSEKKNWIEHHLKWDKNILICSQGLDKKEMLKKHFDENVEGFVLIDDFDKNTVPFGQDGFLVPSGGIYETF